MSGARVPLRIRGTPPILYEQSRRFLAAHDRGPAADTTALPTYWPEGASPALLVR